MKRMCAYFQFWYTNFQNCVTHEVIIFSPSQLEYVGRLLYCVTAFVNYYETDARKSTCKTKSDSALIFNTNTMFFTAYVSVS